MPDKHKKELLMSAVYAIITPATNMHTPVAQWIEQWPPEPRAVVRFHSGVPELKVLSQSNTLFL